MVNPKTLRQAIVTGLTGATSAGASVYDSRMSPWQPSELPALTVYSQSANEQNLSISSAFMRRIETIVVEAIVSGTVDADVASDLDDLEDQVKTFLLTNQTWSADIEKIGSIAVKRGRDIESGKRTMISQIGIQVEYVVAYEPVIGDDLDTVDLTVDEPTDTPQVEAIYTLP